MLNDSARTSDQGGQRAGYDAGYDYEAGAAVCDREGNKIGSLSELGVQNGCLVVRHGILPPRDAWVPLERITRLDPNAIFLNLGKDDLSGLDRDEQSTASTSAMGPADGGSQTIQHAPVHLRMLPDQGQTMEKQRWGTPDGLQGTQNTERADAPAMADQQEVRIPVREEELVAGKREKEIGRVHVGKDVVEEQQTVSAPVTHEEVYIEHVPTEGRSAEPGDDAFQERDIDVPVKGEELVTGKRAEVTDEVRIGKRDVTEQQQATDTVRKERLHTNQAQGQDYNTGTDDQTNITGTDDQPLGDSADQETRGTVEPAP